MEQTAKRFEDANSELDALLGRLMNELETVRSGWQGRASRSFDEVKEAWAADQRSLHRSLGETAAAIRTAGHFYTESDTDAADRISATHRGGISLPL